MPQKKGSTPWNKRPAEERFWEKVDKSGDCWKWKGHTNIGGYGTIKIGDKNVLAHRYSLELSLGRPITKGLKALHSCDNPDCVNPSHLREGTQKENMKDASERQRFGNRSGESNGNSKFTNDDILTIRMLYDSGFTQKQIAVVFKTFQPVISRIILGKQWPLGPSADLDEVGDDGRDGGD